MTVDSDRYIPAGDILDILRDGETTYAPCEMCDETNEVADMFGDVEGGYICYRCQRHEQAEEFMTSRRFW